MRIKAARRAVAVALLTASVAGCSSVKSTYFHRNDDDTKWRKNHIDGVPITLDVPTHVRFSVFETRYLVARAKTGDDAAKSSKTMEMVMLDHSRPLVTYNVTYDFITEKKIFGVDFKRPAAGPFSLAATFTGQYFNEVDHRLTDQTIEKLGTQINKLIGQLVPAIKPGPVAKGGARSASETSPASAPIPLDSLICARVFKLDAPDFELQVAEFLGEHCHATAAAKAAPFIAVDQPVAGHQGTDQAAPGAEAVDAPPTLDAIKTGPPLDALPPPSPPATGPFSP